jgi:transglutaminase-like putative cysteine protease
MMNWRLAVEHVTTYSYAGDVLASYNESRITPARDEQLVLDHAVQVTPRVPIMRYVDYWGTEVCAFDVTEPHRTLVVTGSSLVETGPARPVPDTIDWDHVRASEPRDEYWEYLTSSAFVPCDDARVVAAAAELAALATPAAAVRAACEWTRNRLVYEPGATTVTTTASEALDLGRGVCQDFVHVAIAVLRACDIPARYASGYLHPHEDAEVGRTVTGQSHAWLEAWLGDWYPADPTSGAAAGERHVLVARGRDYRDVAPVKGVFHGPPDLNVDVRVTIKRVA